MKDYKNIIKDSRYLQQLLKEIGRVKNFDAVPEVLYYEAVVFAKALKQSNGDKAILGVLTSFIKMCNVKNLTDEELPRLVSLNKCPRYTDVDIKKLSRNKAHEAVFVKVMPVVLVIYAIFVVALSIYFVHDLTHLYQIILGFVILLALFGFAFMPLSDCVYIIIAEILDNMHKKEKMSIEVCDINLRTKSFLKGITKPACKTLTNRLKGAKRYTTEYYEVCADIELKYFDERVNN